LKKKVITYNPKGLKRVNNVAPVVKRPKKDLNSQNIKIEKSSGYWKVSKK